MGAFDLVLALRHTRDQYHGLVRESVTRAEHAIRDALGRDVRLQEETVRLFLDDFTTADLHTARLTNIDLTGVRWSQTGTRWPEEVNIADLKAHSDTIDAERGLYVVREGWTVRDFVDLG